MWFDENGSLFFNPSCSFAKMHLVAAGGIGAAVTLEANTVIFYIGVEKSLCSAAPRTGRLQPLAHKSPSWWLVLERPSSWGQVEFSELAKKRDFRLSQGASTHLLSHPLLNW